MYVSSSQGAGFNFKKMHLIPEPDSIPRIFSIGEPDFGSLVCCEIIFLIRTKKVITEFDSNA